jgi:hypothetical protein
VAVAEPDEVRRGAVVASDLEHLCGVVRRTHLLAVEEKPFTDLSLHTPPPPSDQGRSLATHGTGVNRTKELGTWRHRLANLPTVIHLYGQIVDILRSRSLQTATLDDVFYAAAGRQRAVG